MRWASNKESVAKGEPTVQAISETLIATAISVWIVVHFGTWTHVAIGSCVAPLLLLRTEDSCRIGARIVKVLGDRLTNIDAAIAHPLDTIKQWARLGWLGRTRVVISLALFPLYLLVILMALFMSFLIARAGGTIVGFLCHPLHTLGVIPSNWRRVTCVLDFWTGPELLPLPKDRQKVENLPAEFGNVYALVADILRDAREASEWKDKLEVAFVAIALPAFLYRWSLKSTAIVWFPLLFVIDGVKDQTGELLPRLRAWLRHPWNRLVRAVSAFLVLAFLLKVLFLMVWNGVAAWWDSTRVGQVLSVYVAPCELQWWQVATFVNSLLVWVLWIYLRGVVIHLEEGLPQNGATVTRAHKTVLVIRRILTCYTISCTLYLTVREASHWRLPPLGTKPFPWW